jgi:DNA-binding Lrp family transcriptional regulator
MDAVTQAQTVPDAAATVDFVDDLAALLSPWGVPPTAGRLYAYLMLHDRAISLDEIAERLGMSKAGAWNAARFLENSGNIRRSTERGSKRVYFRIIDDMAPCQLEQMRALGAVGRLLASAAPKVSTGETRARLERTGAFCMAMERMIAEAHERHRAGLPPA